MNEHTETRPRSFLALCIGVALLIQPVVNHALIGGNATLFRVFGVLVIIWVTIRTRYRIEAARLLQGRVVVGVVGAMTLYIFVATIPHGQYSAMYGYATGGFLLALMVWFAGQVDGIVIAKATALVVGLLVVGSLLVGAAGLSFAYLGGRLQGTFGNPNTLGFFALIFLAAGAHVLRGWKLVAVAGVVIAALAWSASRGGALATVVALAGIWFARRRVNALADMAVICVLGYLIIQFFPGVGELFNALIRDNNSRADPTFSFSRSVAENPWFGLGQGNAPVQVASTPLRAAVEGGWVGFAIIMLLYVRLLMLGRFAGPITTALVAGGIASSLVEGWFLSPLSPLAMVYLLLLVGVASSEIHTDPGTATANDAAPQSAPIQTPQFGRQR